MISSLGCSNRSIVTPKKDSNSRPLGEKVTAIFLLTSGIAYSANFTKWYLGFPLELRAQQPVQNDRNYRIMLGESGFQERQTFAFWDIHKKPIIYASAKCWNVRNFSIFLWTLWKPSKNEMIISVRCTSSTTMNNLISSLNEQHNINWEDFVWAKWCQ